MHHPIPLLAWALALGLAVTAAPARADAPPEAPDDALIEQVTTQLRERDGVVPDATAVIEALNRIRNRCCWS